ncbi:MAG: endonuclease III [Candidatus Taylorbacteria bacterium]|nr:endonuclease III [Candidatus Taylorbacteria bacterium]
MNSITALKQLKALEKNVATMRLAAEEWKEEWQTLLAILMSARTRDETTIIVAEKLFTAFPTLTALAYAKETEVRNIVMQVNFFQDKAKRVIACAKLLLSESGGRVPHDIEKLITLPGVGRKTANVFLAEYGTPAIGVDTHVSYISQKLGWTLHRTPEKIEEDLMNLFPKKYWRIVNRTLVRFGKTHQSRASKDALLARIAKGKSV